MEQNVAGGIELNEMSSQIAEGLKLREALLPYLIDIDFEKLNILDIGICVAANMQSDIINKCLVQTLEVGKASNYVAVSDPKDLSGKHFGDWRVIKAHRFRKPGKGRTWICQCTCGNIGYVQGYALIKGHSKSCGCQANKYAQETLLKQEEAAFMEEMRRTFFNIDSSDVKPKLDVKCPEDFVADGLSEIPDDVFRCLL